MANATTSTVLGLGTWPLYFSNKTGIRAGGEVGLFGGHFIPLDRTYHPPHAQWAGGDVHHLFQPGGCGNHPIHRFRPVDYSASNPETVEADAGDERIAAQAEGDSRPVFQGPVPSFPRNHAPLPGGRGKPHWLPGPDGGPDADTDWPVPGVDSDTFLPPRQPGRFVGEDVYLDTGRPDLRGGAYRFSFSMAGPSRIRPDQAGASGARLRFNLGPAEDDHAAVDRSAAVGQPGNDALADAPNDCVFLIHAAQRSVSILDYIQHDWHSHPIFHHRWLGATIPTFPKIRPASGVGRSSPAIPR